MAQRIALTGASGLIGSALVDWFKKRGDAVTRIVRDTSSRTNDAHTVLWDIDREKIEADKLEGQDGIIHLAGASIAGRRWTPEYKRAIQESRVKGTAHLCRTLAQLKQPPRVLVCASAIGYYGNQASDAPVDESAPAGQGFLSDVCRQWEQAAQPAESRGIRVVYARFGVVLSPQGGALGKMLPIFKCGLGGPLGGGRQIMSWVALDEIPYLVSYLIDRPPIRGTVNCVSPSAVSNREFTDILGRVIRRPVIFPVPGFGIKLLFGKMGEELLLGGARVVPRRLLENGYSFQYPDLEKALENILKEK